MDVDEVMAELAAAGSERTRTTYRRHGVNDPVFGVSYATLGKLQRRIGTDDDLAIVLWDTANHDARILAAKIADRHALTVRRVDRWIRDCDNYVVMEACAGMVAESPLARGRSDAWRDRRDEWVSAAGWFVVACTAGDRAVWTDAELRSLVKQIEAEIHDRPNRVRHEMNAALIAIGIRGPGLRRSAVASARRIGVVDVDHGPTSCTTPDAIDYIERTVARRAG